ncbi:MAG: FixH family protein [bacterium]|nr:FixH family protein [bacterium]
MNLTPSQWNYWPWAILALFGGMVLSVSMVINLSLTHARVELDNQYPYDYHQVDDRFAELEQMARDFSQQSYALEPVGLPQLGSNAPQLRLSRLGEPVAQAQIQALWTRPATTKADQSLGQAVYVDGLYRFEPQALSQGGCWHLNTYVQVGGLEVARQFVYYLPHQPGAPGRLLAPGQVCKSQMD